MIFLAQILLGSIFATSARAFDGAGIAYPTPAPGLPPALLSPPRRHGLRAIYHPPPTLLGRLGKRQGNDCTGDDQTDTCPLGEGCCFTSSPVCCYTINLCCGSDDTCCGSGCCGSDSICVDGQMCMPRAYASSISSVLSIQSQSEASIRSSSEKALSSSISSYVEDQIDSATAEVASAKKNKNTTVGAIGGVLGALLAIALGVIIWLLIRRRKKTAEKAPPPASVSEVQPLNYGGPSPPPMSAHGGQSWYNGAPSSGFGGPGSMYSQPPPPGPPVGPPIHPPNRGNGPVAEVY